MSYESVKDYFHSVGLGDRVVVRDLIIDTVEDAAKSVGCEPRQIAKTMSFMQNGEPVLIVAAGDARISNAKYRSYFRQKATMIPGDHVKDMIGHEPGAVCPFAIRKGIRVFLDISLQRFDIVHASAGGLNHTVSLSPAELEAYSSSIGWIDVCKGWYEEET